MAVTRADSMQGRNHGENLVATSAMVGRICPPGGDRVKVSENLGATAVAPVAPADTSLHMAISCKLFFNYILAISLTKL